MSSDTLEVTPGAERRLKPRYALHLTGQAEVLYRRLPPPTAGPSPVAPGRFKVESVNVSSGGFMLTFDTDISDGDSLRLFFPLPDTDQDVRFEGNIQWLRRNASNLMGRYCAGVAFKNTSPEVVDTLVAYAARHNPEPLK